MKKREIEKRDAIASLKETIVPGTLIMVDVIKCSNGGTFSGKVYAIRPPNKASIYEPLTLTWNFAKAFGMRLRHTNVDGSHLTELFSGSGVRHATVYEIARLLGYAYEGESISDSEGNRIRPPYTIEIRHENGGRSLVKATKRDGRPTIYGRDL